MRISRHVRFATVIGTVVTLAATAGAQEARQETRQETRNIGFDFTIGGSGSSGAGVFNPRTGPGIDALFSDRVHSFRLGGGVAAISTGFQASFTGFGDTCRIA